MQAGSIEMEAEGDKWKWVFKGRRLLTYGGVVVYEDQLSPAWLEAVR